MKKLIAVLGCVTLLSGCNMDSVFKKNEAQTEENSSSQNNNNNEGIEESKTEQPTDSNETNSEDTENKLTLESIFFNELLEVENKQVIQNPTNIMVLVNPTYALQDQYTPEDLVVPNVAFSFGGVHEKSHMRKEAAEALEKMFQDAANNGIELLAISGYRSYNRQKEVFDAQVSKSGFEEASKLVAVPGNSEHQTGLSMDIASNSVSAQNYLVEAFGETVEGKWLMENAHRFGFILRYPNGKEDITGYDYEPWHYRYVGVKPAKEIYENGLTLEEYFHIVEKI